MTFCSVTFALQLVEKCIQCLAVVINKVTNNYQLITDCFNKYISKCYYYYYC